MVSSRLRNLNTGELVVGGAAVVIVIVLAIVLVVLASRGPSQGGSGSPVAGTTTSALPPTTGSSGPATAPAITAFHAPAGIRCAFATRVEVSWATTNAAGVELAVDGGPGPFLFAGPQGTATLPFACDGSSHTYTLTARGSGGPPAMRTLTVVQS
jgi:hypothetical protein